MNALHIGVGLVLAFANHPFCAAEGLWVPASLSFPPPWRASLGLPAGGSIRWNWHDGIDAGSVGPTVGGALLGDYFFDRSALDPNGDAGIARGSLRATSGVLLGQRSRLTLQPPGTAPWLAGMSMAPYVGIGYSGWSLKGGWGFTADLGLAGDVPATSPGIGRTLLTPQGIDARVRDLRLGPMLQLGVGYAF